MDALPTLSVDGFITNRSLIVLKLYEHFLVSEHSQSLTYIGSIASLKYILNEATNITELEAMCVAALTKMYERYFPTVNVDVIIDETGSKMGITVNVVVTDYDTKVYKLNELISVVNNQIINMDQSKGVYHAR